MELLTVKELAQYLKCSTSCIWVLKREHKIPIQQGIASKVLFDKDDIDKYLKENKTIVFAKETKC